MRTYFSTGQIVRMISNFLPVVESFSAVLIYWSPSNILRYIRVIRHLCICSVYISFLSYIYIYHGLHGTTLEYNTE